MDSSKQKNGRCKRRRATPAQRQAANERERRRMANLGIAFKILRSHIPTFVYERSLTRIETLKMAIDYIQFMKYELLLLPLDVAQQRYGDAFRYSDILYGPS